jgi:transcriptional regulator with XRE-family HTH domain
MKKSQRDKAVLCPFLAPLLRSMRRAEDLSQEEFAEILDISARGYSNEERGRSLGSSPTILRLLNRLDDPRPVIRRCVELLDDARLADPDD